MSDIIPATRISPLRQRLIDDMTMRRFSHETQRSYIRDDRPPISRTRGLARVPLGLFGRDVAERGVDPPSVVVAFDVGEQVASCLVPGRPSSLMSEFDLQGVKEAFHRSVVVTAASSAH